MRTRFIVAGSVAVLTLASCMGDESGVSSPTDVAFAKIEGASQGGRLFTADLLGTNEIPTADPDGTGHARVTFNRGQKTVCFELSYENIDTPTRAHIHRGGADVASGPIVIGFFVPPAVDPSDLGCVTADPEIMQEVTRNPSGFYVNIHNAVYPAGAIRGQLQK